MKLNKVILIEDSVFLEENINKKLEKVVFAENGTLIDIKFIPHGPTNNSHAVLIIYSVEVEVTMELEDTKDQKIVKSS